jgi:hypothetical protein
MCPRLHTTCPTTSTPRVATSDRPRTTSPSSRSSSTSRASAATPPPGGRNAAACTARTASRSRTASRRMITGAACACVPWPRNRVPPGQPGRPSRQPIPVRHIGLRRSANPSSPVATGGLPSCPWRRHSDTLPKIGALAPAQEHQDGGGPPPLARLGDPADPAGLPRRLECFRRAPVVRKSRVRIP